MAHVSKIVPAEGEQPGFCPGRPRQGRRTVSDRTLPCTGLHREVSMTGTKLSVEKALNKIRETDIQKSETARMDEETAELDESIKRMRAQRQRLEAHQRRSTTEGASDESTGAGQPSAARPSFFAWLFGRKG